MADADDPSGEVMDDDELETTMRHGLRELANDAPRGDRLWETTTGMIAIQPGSIPPAPPRPQAQPEPAPPPPPVPPAPSKSRLGLGILIGFILALALVLAGVALALALRSDSGNSKGSKPKNSPATVTPAWGKEAIPPNAVVYTDAKAGRIVVANKALKPVGFIVPTDDATWRAVQLSDDRSHLYVTKSGGDCNEIFDYDLVAQSLQTFVPQADVLALSPDAKRSVITWGSSCAEATQQTEGDVALRDTEAGTETTLKEIAGGRAVNVAWSPDGQRFAVEPIGSHHVYVFDARVDLTSQFDHPPSSEDALGWTSQGLILVDRGLDGSAVLRRYDPASGTPFGEIGRFPGIAPRAGAQPEVPIVSTIREVDGRIFVEGGVGPATQLREAVGGHVPLVVGNWTGRELAG